MKKVFVTGGNGFLGKFLVKYFKDKFVLHYPNSIECNLTKLENLEKFNTIKYDYIFHLAAWTQAGDFCLKHPSEQWVINQYINTNIINWWQNQQSQAKLITIGTSCSYSDKYELIEENYLKGEPIESLYTYAMTKRMLHNGLVAAEKQYKLNWLCFVPSTLYGPNYHEDGRQMHFIFDLVRKITTAKKTGEKVTLWGNGFQKREIVYVSDFLNAFEKLLEKNNEIINIGSGREYSIKEFASMICKIINFEEQNIIYDENKYVGAKSKILNINKLLSYLPNYSSQQKNINEGLKELVYWFNSNGK